MDLTYRYDSIAPRWTEMISEMGFPAAYQSLVRSIPPTAAKHVCDVGCGSGSLAQAFVQHHGLPQQLTLVDRSEGMLDQASAMLRQNRWHPTRRCEDLADLMPDVAFDVTLCAHVIEHCPCPKEALAHLARITRPGGTILLAVSKPHLCQWLIWLKWRHSWLSEAEIAEICQSLNLRLENVVPFAAGIPARISQGYVITKPIGA